ncbi:Uncharacterised protein [Kocuria rosea]|nr:Uncharacterised protein [Kocuria rosea]
MERRGVRVFALVGVGRVLVPEPGHELGGQQRLVLLLGVGGAGEVGVGDRIDQHLLGDRRPAVLARPQGHDGREVAAGAVPADVERDLRPGDLRQVLAGPGQGGPGVLHRGGEGVLRGLAVVHEDDGAARLLGQLPAQGVVAVDVLQHPAAAVEVDEHAGRGLPRHVHPDAEAAAVGGVQDVVLGAVHLGARPEHLVHGGGGGAGLGRAHLPHGLGVGPGGLGGGGQEGEGGVVQGHGCLLIDGTVPAPLVLSDAGHMTVDCTMHCF